MGAGKKSIKLALKRKAEFLSSPDTNRWYENVRRGSKITAEIHRRNLVLFLRETHIKHPSDLLSLGEKELRDLVLDFVTSEEKRGVSGGTTITRLKAIKSWLSFNGIRVAWPIKVNGAQDTPTVRDEGVPTEDELRRVFLAASPRTRVAVALMAHSGMRPEVIGNFEGDDGLRIADLPELSLRGGKVTFAEVPTRVVVRSQLSKTHKQYFSFLGEEGCGYLSLYLSQRMAAGEKITPDSDLIHADVETHPPKAFIRTTNVGDAIRKAIRAAGYDFRPYALRCYFDTQLLLAESKGKVAHDYRVFWMGHKGSMDAHYTTNKGRLPASMLADMREAYKRAEPFLSTTGKRADPQEAVAGAIRLLLQARGVPQDKIDNLEIAGKSDAEIAAILKDVLAPPVPEKAPTEKGAERAVLNSEADKLLEAGWQYVGPLGPDRVVMRAPVVPSPAPAGIR